jgi:hypothetical protein
MSISCEWNRAEETITWSSDQPGIEPVVARLGEMDEEIREYAMFHGLAARGTDTTAMAMDHWDGKDKPKRRARDDEKLARCRVVIEHLNRAKGWESWGMRKSSDPLAGKSAAELESLIKAAQARIASLGIVDTAQAE